MKNLFFLLTLIFVSFISFAQKLDKDKKENKYSLFPHTMQMNSESYDYSHSWPTRNLQKEKFFAFSTFVYENVRYPIVDSSVRNRYGGLLYGKSFTNPVVVDSTSRILFSLFLLKRTEVRSYNELVDGYLVIKNKTTYLNKQKSWFEFSIFFVLLPILFYFLSNVPQKGFDLKLSGNHFSLVFILLGPIFYASFSNDVLYRFSYLKLHNIVPVLFLSKIIFTFFTVLIISWFFYFLYYLKTERLKQIYFRVPYTLFISTLSSLLAGVLAREINYSNLLLIIFVAILGFFLVFLLWSAILEIAKK